jgi:hypothetical protein
MTEGFAKTPPSPPSLPPRQALETIGAQMYADEKRYYYRRGKEGRLLRLIFENICKGAWAQPHLAAINTHANFYIDMIWARVQALIRGWLARIKYKRRLANLAEERRQARRLKAAIKLQAFARRVLGRLAGVRLAQETYIKYLEPGTSLPYWFFPRIKRSVWVKPKMFGPYYDCLRAKRLPDKTTEFLILCVNCDASAAQAFCDSCEEAFCSDCFDAIHLKGHKREHVRKTILMCPDCKYQMATKVCKQCSLKAGRRVAYCDVCFRNVHDETEKLRKHRFEDLVMNCVECEMYAARWRCVDCHDLYCTNCFSKVHARGKKLRHRYEALRYYTAGMHKSYEYELNMMDKKKEMARHMITVRAIIKEKRDRAATAIQKTWRGMKGRIKGREKLHIGRRKMRAYYRLRKADDTVRRQRSYKFMDSFGQGMRLDSDTMEEKVLKHFPKSKRELVRSRIKGNLEFAPGQVKDRKKVPKRGFNIGTEAELVEQGTYGGTRLPGFYTIREGERIVYATTDLRKTLNKKSRIRIRDLCFSIDEDRGVQADCININRLWRRDSVENIVIYKMPDLTTMQRIGHMIKFFLATSTPVQIGINTRANMELKLVSTLENLQTFLKGAGFMSLADQVKLRIEHHSVRARRIRFLLNQFQEKFNQDKEEVVADDGGKTLMAEKEAQKKKEFEDKYLKKVRTNPPVGPGLESTP